MRPIARGRKSPDEATQGRSRSAAPGRSLAAAVYAELLKAINDGRFRPGDRIMETAVADWLRVSRTPVREALRRLESEDVLAKGTQGLVVVAMDESEVEELYDLREALEVTAARFAASNASTTDLRALRGLLDEQARCGDGEAAALAAINRNFHVALAQASGNRFLLKSLNALQDAFLRLRSTTFSLPGRPALALAEHRAIVRAIERGDAAGAARAAGRHIRESRRCRRRLDQPVTNGPGVRARIDLGTPSTMRSGRAQLRPAKT